MTPEHKEKIRRANADRYAAMTDNEKKAWQAKRLEARNRSFALLKELRKLSKR